MQANAADVLVAHSAKVVIVIIVAALPTSKAMSETVVFSCEFVGPPENSGRREAAVDRVVVNYDARQIDFQVTKTMGTKEQLNWTLMDRKEYDDQFNIRTPSDDEFVGMGTVGGLPTMVTFKRRVLRWITFTSRGDVDIDTTYRCLR
jgi:hypothetical protein